MIIKLKDSITTQKGVIFPKGYEIPCDALVNLVSGVTTSAMIEPDGTITPLGLTFGTQDLDKLEIRLEYPK